MLAHEGISKLGSAKSRSSKKVQFKNKSDDSIEKPAKPPPSKQGKKNGDKPDNPFIRAKTNNFFSDTMPNMHKPKSDSYEKKYFQQMLSKLQRSHSLPENKISRYFEMATLIFIHFSSTISLNLKTLSSFNIYHCFVLYFQFKLLNTKAMWYY